MEGGDWRRRGGGGALHKRLQVSLTRWVHRRSLRLGGNVTPAAWCQRLRSLPDYFALGSTLPRPYSSHTNNHINKTVLPWKRSQAKSGHRLDVKWKLGREGRAGNARWRHQTSRDSKVNKRLRSDMPQVSLRWSGCLVLPQISILLLFVSMIYGGDYCLSAETPADIIFYILW